MSADRGQRWRGRRVPKGTPQTEVSGAATRDALRIEAACSAIACDPPRASVLIAIPSAGQIEAITMATVQALVQQTRLAGEVFIAWQTAQPVARCRNLLAQRFLQDQRYTHLLFVDTDMAVPPGGLDCLLATGAPLACGPAPVLEPGSLAGGQFRAPGIQTNIGIAEPGGGGREAPARPSRGATYRWLNFDECPAEPFHCDVSGLSFCLIAREVLDRLEPPWFTFVDLPGAQAIGEDVYFFSKARAMGYRLLVHPAATCDHIKRVDLSRVEYLIGATPPPPLEQPLVREPLVRESLLAPTPRESSPAPRTGQYIPTRQPLPRILVLACTRDGRLELETAECLLRWQADEQIQAGVQLVEAPDAADALRWFMDHPTSTSTGADPAWDRLLLLGRDIVPKIDTIRLLATVDTPLVAALYRQISGGEIVYHFDLPEPDHLQRSSTKGGSWVRPANLTEPQCRAPLAAGHVGLDCTMIRREAWPLVEQALAAGERNACKTAAGQATGDHALDWRLSELVRAQCGCGPIVLPHLVTRRAQLGLLRFVELRRTLQARAKQPRKEPALASSAAVG